MKTILVTGSNGLLGQKIVYALRDNPSVKCIACSRGPNRIVNKTGYHYVSVDLTDKEAVMTMMEEHAPDAIIHTAAMTNVDACEGRQEEAWIHNVVAVEQLVEACEKSNSHLVHLSTDFVFNGKKGPYIETDEVDPLSHYAYTKVEAEKRIMASKKLSWSILRTIIIYGVVDDNSRSNLVLWVFNALRNQKTITVINDQFRSPTLAEDLANACIAAALKRSHGIYHVSGREVMNIIDIAYIVADYFQLDASFIKPVSSEELNQPAMRPPVTGFIIDKAVRDLDFQPLSFLDGLSAVKNQLKLVGAL